MPTFYDLAPEEKTMIVQEMYDVDGYGEVRFRPQNRVDAYKNLFPDWNFHAR